jgi:4-amino-4-deoxy-L-arabinose transferase-like glycosyltransferase
MCGRGPEVAQERRLWRPDRGVVVVLAIQAAVLLGLAPRYGPHRDELYFAAAGDRLAWGYPDQGWVTPALARLSTELAGHNLVALRVAPAVLMLMLTLVASHGARVLGGTAAAAVLTACVTASGAVVMANGHLLTTAAIDMVAWAAVLVLVTQALIRDQPRLWVAAGVVAGLGLSNKFTVAILLGALLVAAFCSSPARRQLVTPWPWAGGVVAGAIWLPNLAWQHRHGWPQFELANDIATEFGGVHGRVAIIGELAVMFSPLLLLVWVAGLVALLVRQEWAVARAVPLAFVIALVVLLVTAGKGYYLAGAVVPFLAAACVVLCDRWDTQRLVLAATALVASAGFTWPTVVPVLPIATYADSTWRRFDDDQAETIGWPAYAAQVRRVLHALPETQRQDAVVFTQNYAQAGALEWYGVDVGVYSGHNGYADWGPPPVGAGPWIVVGDDPVTNTFRSCRLADAVGDPWQVHNSEADAEIWVCAGPVEGGPKGWDRLRRLSA